VVVGKTNQMIALELGTSKKTIDAQRASMMQKMKADTLADLIRLNLHLRQQFEAV